MSGDISPDEGRANRRVVQATEWVSSLDRSALAGFCVSDSDLAVVYAIAMSKQDSLNHFREQSPASSIFSREQNVLHDKMVSLAAHYKDAPFNIQRGYGELVMRKMVSNDWVMTDEVIEWAARYTSLTSYPQYRAFFESGVWDVAIIEHCVANDIDAELALSLGGIR